MKGLSKQQRFWRGKKFQIKSALRLLGVEYEKESRRRFRSNEGSMVQDLRLTSVDFQWSCFEKAKNNFRSLVKEHHSDKGGNVESFRNTVMAWRYARVWFSKLGIE